MTNFYETYPRTNVVDAFKKLSELLLVDLESFEKMKEDVNYYWI